MSPMGSFVVSIFNSSSGISLFVLESKWHWQLTGFFSVCKSEYLTDILASCCLRNLVSLFCTVNMAMKAEKEIPIMRTEIRAEVRVKPRQ